MNTKTLFTAAAAVLLSTSAAAGPLDQDDTYGSVLFDLDQSASTAGYTPPTGAAAQLLYSSDTYGSVLYDLGKPSHEHTLATPPAVGDDADDWGSVLYDNGARY